MTGALNPRGFFDFSQRELDHAREVGRTFGLLMVDIDHFKSINDQHGHPVGDAALRHLVGVLRAGLRSVDLIGRVGGEEFAIVLAAISLRQLLHVAERLHAAVTARRTRGYPVAPGREQWPEPYLSRRTAAD